VSLTKGHWVTIGVTIGAVILTAVFHICIREWYQPDIRYEEGSWYRSTGYAIGSLKLQNFGHSDAEDVQIIASFSEPITDIATNDPSVTFKVINGGVGKKEVCGLISRIVPDEKIYVYFATENPSLLNLPSSFISNIKFKGGKGKAGKPLFSAILGGIIGLVIGMLAAFLTAKRFEKIAFESHYTNLEKSIMLGLTSGSQGLSEEQLKKKLETEFGKVSFRKFTLFRAAISAYKAIRGIKDTKLSSN